MLKLSDEVYNKLDAELRDRNKTNWSGVCKGAIFDIEGKLTSNGHTACHSWVGTGFSTFCAEKNTWGAWDAAWRKDAKNFVILNCHSKNRSKNVCSEEAHEFLIDWIASDDCPFGKYILNRHDPDSLHNGGVMILCGPDGANHSEAMWVCKVLRFCTEGGKAAETFMALKQGGVDGMLAVLVSSFVRTVQGATFGFTGIEAHSSVFATYTFIDAKSLVQRKVNPKANSTASLFSDLGHDPTYRGDAAIRAKIQGFCKPVQKSDGWGGTVNSKGADAKDLIERVLEWQKELGAPLGTVEIKPPPKKKMPDSRTVYLDLDL